LITLQKQIMKAMKLPDKKFLVALMAVSVMIGFTSCKKLLGLERQTSEDHPTTTIDPHIHKTAWQFLKDRALGNPDTIFLRMYEAVMYSGIDTNEYIKPGRTFIFLHNDAVVRKSGSTTTTDSYWGKYKVNGQAATS